MRRLSCEWNRRRYHVRSDDFARIAVLTAAPTRRMLLREYVHDAHEELDSLIGDLTTHSAYHRYLRGIAAFRFAAEKALAHTDFPAWFDGWRPVTTAVSLQHDLDSLDLVPPEAPVIAPPRGDSAMLGMLYTLEGSALGGRVIARRAAALGYHATNGAGHLGVQTGAPENWRVFLALLEKAPVFDADEAGAAASVLFRHARDAVTLADRAEEKLYG